MKLNKVGDCLSYGLTYELLDEKQTQEHAYLKSAIAFLFLGGYINGIKVGKIKDLMYAKSRGVGDPKAIFDKIFRLIAGEMKRKVEFESFEDLVVKLDQFSIPEWMYNTYNVLFRLMPDIYLIDDNLYYIEKREEGFVFCRTNVEEMDFSNARVDGLDEDVVSRTLSYSYSHIMGYNKELGIIYLKPSHMNDIYVEYHVDTEQEVVYHNKCLGLIGNILLIEADDYLAIKVGNRIKRIKRTDALESYTIEDNEIYVTPCVDGPLMFKPYRITVGGEVIPASYAEEKAYLWNQIRRAIHPFYNISRNSNTSVYNNDNTQDEQDTFSLKYVSDYFKEENNYEGNVNARICLFLVKILGKYFDMDQDVLDHFYIILEASRRYDKYALRGYLSEEVYWKIEELETCGELEKCIYDLNEFREKLVEYAYWDDEKLETERKGHRNDCKIGYFKINESKIDAVSVSLEEGSCMGNITMMPGMNMEGSVMFDYELGKFFVQYSRLLSGDEIEEIESLFNLEDKRYHIVIEGKNK